MGTWGRGLRDGFLGMVSWEWVPGDGVLGTCSRATESWERAYGEFRGTGSLETWSLGRGPGYGVPGDGFPRGRDLGEGIPGNGVAEGGVLGTVCTV